MEPPQQSQNLVVVTSVLSFRFSHIRGAQDAFNSVLKWRAVFLLYHASPNKNLNTEISRKRPWSLTLCMYRENEFQRFREFSRGAMQHDCMLNS